MNRDKHLIDTSFLKQEYRELGDCLECDIELNDCNLSCGGLCRECYDKIAIKVRPFPHDDFNFPIAKGIEQRKRIWLVGIDTKTVEGFVDFVSQIDANQCFRYAFAPENSKKQFNDYEWNGIEIFDPKKQIALSRFICPDKYILTHWDSMIIWICSILNRCSYKWSISTKDFTRQQHE